MDTEASGAQNKAETTFRTCQLTGPKTEVAKLVFMLQSERYSTPNSHVEVSKICSPAVVKTKPELSRSVSKLQEVETLTAALLT